MKMKEDQATNNHYTNEDEEETYQDSDEAEEALSLCDLPLAGNDDASNCKENPHHHHHRPSPHQEMFEFFSDDRSNSESMSSAEDIIFGGKLLPYNCKSNTAASDKSEKNQRQRVVVVDEVNQCFDFKTASSFYHRKSESVGELRRSQSSMKDPLIRSSHSLDYRKLQRGSSTKMIGTTLPARRTDRSSSGNCFGKCELSSRRLPVSSFPARPRWHLFMFGLMRTPMPEMELRDIRNRLSRRSPSSMFPAPDGGETVSVKRDEGKGSWRLLRTFGCKGHANAVVTASLGCIRHV